MTATQAPRDAMAGARRRRFRLAPTVTLLAAASIVVCLASMSLGAAHIPPGRILEIVGAGVFGGTRSVASPDATILLGIRAPRTLLGYVVGGALALSGALLQALFRNPLADPGLIGVSGGAALAAAGAILAGDHLLAPASPLASALTPCAAFFGGLATTSVLYILSTRLGRTSVATMLLAGVGVAALTTSVTGLMLYLSDDRQLRDITFWSLGSLGGATWGKLAVAAALAAPVFIAVPFLARGLNALALGEAEAFCLGVPAQRLKRVVIGLVSLAVGVSVALAGPIGFVGIIVPHLLRLTVGPDHRLVLPGSILLGGVLLVLADILARTLAAPAEIPIGIFTALMGAPFFLWLLSKRPHDFD